MYPLHASTNQSAFPRGNSGGIGYSFRGPYPDEWSRKHAHVVCVKAHHDIAEHLSVHSQGTADIFSRCRKSKKRSVLFITRPLLNGNANLAN